MTNVIIDSSTYGNIIKDKESWEVVVNGIINDPNFIVLNFKIIRDELRKAPSQALKIYDQIVSNKLIPDSKQISNLAEEYYKEYKNNKGGQGKKNIINDFKIVACASIKNCNLLVSDDERTLKCSNAIKAYNFINLRHNFRTPTFYAYSDLKKLYLTK